MPFDFKTIESLSDTARNVLNQIQKDGPITKQKIAEQQQLTMSTLNRILASLEQENLIITLGVAESSGGRPPLLYDVFPKRYVVGVSFGALRFNLTITDFKNREISDQRFPMETSFTPEEFVSHVSSLIFEQLEANHIDAKDVLGIGIGIFGALDYETGILTRPIILYLNEHWIGANLCELFEKATGYICKSDISVNAAALTEQYYSMGAGYSNVLYLNCGVTIRAGFASNGRLIRTKDGQDTAFGHMGICIDGERCSCGNYGCVECYSSIHSILKRFLSASKLGRISSIRKNPTDVTIQDICQAAEEGDLLCSELLTHAGMCIGYGLSNYINFLGPEIVIFSGLLMDLSPLCYETAVETATKRAVSDNIRFVKANPEYDSIAVGACTILIENLLTGRLGV